MGLAMNKRASVFLVLLATLAAGDAAARDAQSPAWSSYRNERFGFTFRYPSATFVSERTSEGGDGEVFVARGGEARLLVGALRNEDGQSLASYQDYIARTSYVDYKIGYRRLATTWFVLSGEANGKTFYEKVMFSCAGRIINSFAMIYPTDQAAIFDRIVEGIEGSFRPGRACEGRTAERDASGFPSQEARERRPALRDPRSALADRIARQRGHDVIVVLRRSSPPYDYKFVRGYASR